jgi:ring-1,2-phenylacetyl-CoA epoxidase subunit PaaE
MSSPKFNTLTVKNIKRETPDSVSVSFHIPDSLKDDYQFIQGQYITFKKEFNGEEVRRSYSICSSPLDGELTVGIKEVEGGKFSTYANRQLKVGDPLDVMTPMGNFFTELKSDNQKNYVAFAAGSGITPILSIIKTTLAKEPQSQFKLVYGNKNSGSIMFLEEIEALKNTYLNRFTVFHILSREAVDVPIFNGRINDLKCKDFCDHKLIDPSQSDEFFLCGPESMIMSVKSDLEQRNVPSKNIHFELFTSSAPIKSTSENSKTLESTGEVSKVSVKIDGLTYQLELPYYGETILDAALKTGADLPFACKGGVCCTCRAKVTQGTVEMDLNFSLEDDEVEKGYILTCQSHPTSAEVFVDFDQK